MPQRTQRTQRRKARAAGLVPRHCPTWLGLSVEDSRDDWNQATYRRATAGGDRCRRSGGDDRTRHASVLSLRRALGGRARIGTPAGLVLQVRPTHLRLAGVRRVRAGRAAVGNDRESVKSSHRPVLVERIRDHRGRRGERQERQASCLGTVLRFSAFSVVGVLSGRPRASALPYASLRSLRPLWLVLLADC